MLLDFITIYVLYRVDHVHVDTVSGLTMFVDFYTSNTKFVILGNFYDFDGIHFRWTQPKMLIGVHFRAQEQHKY